MTRLQLTPDGPEELTAVLQRRGEFNHETLGPESWPGAHQLTVHGKIQTGESFADALHRETGEELGENFASGGGKDWDELIRGIVTIEKINKPKKQIKHLAIEIPPDYLRDVCLNASSGGLKLLRQTDLANIQNLVKSFQKTTGVDSRSVVAMFPDEIEALQKAFEIFSQKA